MKNYLTKYEYTGQNFDTLCELGFDESDSFLTFKQALKLEGVTGKTMKGLKKAAVLMRMVSVEDEETGKLIKQPKYYAVFNAKDVLANLKKQEELQKVA